MDQFTPVPLLHEQQPRNQHGRFRLKPLLPSAVGAIVLLAVLAAGFRLGRTDFAMPEWMPSRLASLLGAPAGPAPTGPVIYYKDPDGKFFYSSEPQKTADGRDFIAVRASEDVSFDDRPEPATPEKTGGQKRVLYYRNPMGLPDTSPVPKKDNMGMDYIPVYEGEDDASTVKISPGKLQRTGVRSETVQRRAVTRPVRVPGTVQLDERRVSVVAMRSDSYLDKVEDVTTGDRVRKGQPLLRLYSPEVAAASAQLAANAGYEGTRRRLENLNVPAEVIAEIERTKKVPPTINWLVPRDGLVLERNATEGMKASAGQVLFRIADISMMWVLADVPEHDLGGVRVGQPVAVRIRSLPGAVFNGTINLIYPQVNRETRTTRVRIELANPDNLLLPDMYADVEITTGAGAPVLAVPDSAIVDNGTRQVVILDKGDGRFEPREVKIGSRGNGYVEIRDGVAENDRVVVAANFLIDAESNLKAALSGFSGGQQSNGQPEDQPKDQPK